MNSRRQDANTLEQQNDAQLDELHGKLRALHAVTIDIHNDSRSQNSLLDTTSNSFDSFTTSLTNSAGRLGRSIQDRRSQPKTIAYGVLAVVVVFFLIRYMW
ncbi:hypothetical protein P389DRAFT_201061 [Cystobasidium minutum MCA 4210]|uniref:uncharacterized protein n=1 Tax=Cystobasidium minutum MCA 4210 TaxID=1397322 RepID=UPI0034CD2B68|eukprot:jgi/Rhomi1/201061/MIX1890_1019_93